MEQYTRYQIGGYRVLAIRYALDNRFEGQHDDNLLNRNRQSIPAISVERLADVDPETVKSADMIIVDEIQFYSDAREYLVKWANQGKVIYGSGLNGDFQQEPFDIVSQLIPHADQIHFVTAICQSTGQHAPFTIRLTQQQDSDQILIGNEIYRAVSRQALLQKK